MTLREMVFGAKTERRSGNERRLLARDRYDADRRACFGSEGMDRQVERMSELALLLNAEEGK
jgi:hypothetical protein